MSSLNIGMLMYGQDHLRGRRHARRLQYLKHMPEQERSKHIERIASGTSLRLCQALRLKLAEAAAVHIAELVGCVLLSMLARCS